MDIALEWGCKRNHSHLLRLDRSKEILAPITSILAPPQSLTLLHRNTLYPPQDLLHTYTLNNMGRKKATPHSSPSFPASRAPFFAWRPRSSLSIVSHGTPALIKARKLTGSLVDGIALLETFPRLFLLLDLHAFRNLLVPQRDRLCQGE